MKDYEILEIVGMLFVVAVVVVLLCFVFGGFGAITGGALFAGALASSGEQ